MNLGQAMLDCHTKVDHRKDFQDLQSLCQSFHSQQDELIKEKKERQALEEYKKQYDPSTLETLCQDKQQLHKAVGRYIIEKNNFKSHIKSLEVDLSDCQWKLEDVEREKSEEFDERNVKINELGRVLEHATTIDGFNDELSKATTGRDGVVKSLKAEVSKLHEELTASLTVNETVGAEREDVEAQLENARKTLADSKRS